MNIIREDKIIQILNSLLMTDFLVMVSAGNQADRDIINVFGYSTDAKKPVKSKLNCQFTNKLQYLITKNRISILSKRSLKKQRN